MENAVTLKSEIKEYEFAERNFFEIAAHNAVDSTYFFIP